MVDSHKRETPSIIPKRENFFGEKLIYSIILPILFIFVILSSIATFVTVDNHNKKMENEINKEYKLNSLNNDFVNQQNQFEKKLNEWDLLKTKIANSLVKNDSVDLDFLKKFSDSALNMQNKTKDEKEKAIAHIVKNYYHAQSVLIGSESISKYDEPDSFETEDEILNNIQNLKTRINEEKKKLVTLYQEDKQQEDLSINGLFSMHKIPCVTTNYDNNGNICNKNLTNE